MRVPRLRVAGAVILVCALPGCARSESDTLDAERTEAATTTSVTPSSVAEEPIVVSEAGFPLTVRVPASWDQTGVGDWVVGQDPKLGSRLVARPADDPAPGSPIPVGAVLSTSQLFLQRYDIPTADFARFTTKWAEFVAGIDYTSEDANCDYRGVSDVSPEGHTYALLRVWTSCGTGTTTIVDVWSADPDTREVIYALVVVEGKAEVKAARDIVGSIADGDGAVFDVES